jgi:hypothetical protein
MIYPTTGEIIYIRWLVIKQLHKPHTHENNITYSHLRINL